LIGSADEIRNEDNAIVAQERANNILAVRLDHQSSQPKLRLHWRDALGKMNSLPVSRLTGIVNGEFRVQAGMAGDAGLSDEL
jgi:hypothetical protein